MDKKELLLLFEVKIDLTLLSLNLETVLYTGIFFGGGCLISYCITQLIMRTFVQMYKKYQYNILFNYILSQQHHIDNTLLQYVQYVSSKYCIDYLLRNMNKLWQ